MNNNIIETNHYLEDTGLIYVPEIDKTGIHLRGLAKLLNCEPKTLMSLKERCEKSDVIEARIKTGGGLQAVTFVLENGIIDILEQVIESTRIKKETRRQAVSVYKGFAKAGFKLYAMMQVAPEQLGMSVIACEGSAPRVPQLKASKINSLWEVRLSEAQNVMLYRFLTKTLPASSQSYLLEGVDPDALVALMGISSRILDYLVAAIEVKELHQKRLFQAGCLTSAGLQQIITPTFDFEHLQREIATAEEYLGRFRREKIAYDLVISRVDVGGGVVSAAR